MSEWINGFFPGSIAPTRTVAGCIDIFENAWPEPLKTIEIIEKECADPESGASWARAGTIGLGVNQDRRTNYLINITETARNLNNEAAKNVHNQMWALLLAATIPYARKHEIEQLHHEGYSLLRYRGGQEYKAHYDGTTLSGRAVSAIIYLNNDYEGGHVEFVHFGIKIKPEPGMLLVFPSNYAYSHIAHPVISGTKYALVTWLHDRPIA